MKGRFPPAKVTVRGILRTEFKYGPPNFGMTPQRDSVETPVILTLTERLDVEPNPPTGEEIDRYSQPYLGITELHIAPIGKKRGKFDWENGLGAVVEVTGELMPAFTGHHHRPLLLFFDEGDIQVVQPGKFDATEDAEIFIRGSGVILNDDGVILTAQHVAKGEAFSVRRRLERVEAIVIANHPQFDISLLQANIKIERPPTIRRFFGPVLGENIYACGFPLRPFLGHGVSITSGLVSSLHAPFPECIYISAPVQFGNSGGPVFDSFGNVLAIVCAKSSPTKLMRKLDTGADVGVELLNLATATVAIEDFLIDNRVKFIDSGFIHVPPDPAANASLQMARLAEIVCVEIEGWRTK